MKKLTVLLMLIVIYTSSVSAHCFVLEQDTPAKKTKTPPSVQSIRAKPVKRVGIAKMVEPGAVDKRK